MLLETQGEYHPLPRITEVIKAVNSSNYDIGLVPIENTTEGNVVETINGLIRSDLSILGEITIPIHHSLIGSKSGLNKQVIHSHPQAIGQCGNWLDVHYPGVEIAFHNSTAEAVQTAVSNSELAIGSFRAANLYNAAILQESIEDNSGNITRFWLLGKGKSIPTGNYRTTMLVTVKEEVGSLVDTLVVLKNHRVNLGKIDSAPGSILDEYCFLLTIDGHQDTTKIARTLSELAEISLTMKILGSYQKSSNPKNL